MLKGFLNDRGKEQVTVFDMDEDVIFHASVKRIMGETRYNDFWVDDETLVSIEPIACDIENLVAPMIQRIREQCTIEIDAEEHGRLALLMAFQLMRTKETRQIPVRWTAQMRKAVSRMGFNPDKVDGLSELDENELKLTHARQQIKSLPEIAALFAEKVYFLASSPEGTPFYIGDHPVVMHNDHYKSGFGRGLGLKAPFVQGYLPLSDSLMLCAYSKEVLGSIMRNRDEALRKEQLSALRAVRDGTMAPQQMKGLLESYKRTDPVEPIITAVNTGAPVLLDVEQVQFYNSLQAFYAHRFVVAPDGNFDVAREMLEEREKSRKALG